MNTIFYTQSEKLMNTDIIISVYSYKLKTVQIKDSINSAFDEFRTVIKKYSRFEQNSELSKLNLNTGKWNYISKEFLYLIDFMLNLFNVTNGLYDPTVIDYLETFGYIKGSIPEGDIKYVEKKIEKIKSSRPRFSDTLLDKKNQRVLLPQNCRLDLGSIGKGFAVDKAYQKLYEADPESSFIINAGGDIRVHGLNEKKQPWLVKLQCKNKVLGYAELQSGFALCSSGTWARKYKEFNHLINPKTGLPVNNYETSFVKAKTAIEADAWATILVLGGENFIPDDLYLEYILV